MAVILLNFERMKITHESPEKRVSSFTVEPLREYTDQEGSVEASRCIGCNICTQSCPASLDIGGYIRSTAAGDPAETVRIVFENLPFPAIIGRVCTHLCEDICVLNDTGGPIAIRHLKRFAADKFDDYGTILNVPRRKFIGKSVAVIGGGPAGLTAAYYLAIQGVSVTLFETMPELGGFMKSGIPRYRLPQDVLDKEIGFITGLGVEVKTSTRVGTDVKFSDLMREYDAVFIGVGNHKARMTGTPGSDAKGIVHATEFLQRVSYGEKINVGKNVVVIGGGFTANDASRTCLRLGAKKVYIMYRRRAIDRPGYPSSNAEEEMEEAIEESVEYLWEVTPFEYVSQDGKVSSVRYWQNEMVMEGRGRAKPVPKKEKVLELPADMVIEATGQETDFSFLEEEYLRQLRLTPQGHVIVDENGMTSIKGLFSGGDSTNINRDLITAVRDADTAVLGILNYLNVMDQIADERWLPFLDRWKKYSPTAAIKS
ncbi:MAG: FAD-dependent oxidoreductase [Candidatus Thermoplasmatota archaeon]|nr:FAD-dependent oxidoreductase [Candidatus Thermoplasmatota archaeon]MCL5786421.1 FAD-dependent oxidoreductase [Candidatus Thermoplasmatota archaeon]